MGNRDPQMECIFSATTLEWICVVQRLPSLLKWQSWKG